LENLFKRFLLQRTGDDIRIFFPAIRNRVTEIVIGDVTDRILNIFAVLTGCRDNNNPRSGCNGVCPLYIQRDLGIPFSENAACELTGWP
jgi:hypothetical protein